MLTQHNFPFLEASSEEILSAASKLDVSTISFYKRTILYSNVDADFFEFLLSFVDFLNLKIVFKYTLSVVLLS